MNGRIVCRGEPIAWCDEDFWYTKKIAWNGVHYAYTGEIKIESRRKGIENNK